MYLWLRILVRTCSLRVIKLISVYNLITANRAFAHKFERVQTRHCQFSATAKTRAQKIQPCLFESNTINSDLQVIIIDQEVKSNNAFSNFVRRWSRLICYRVEWNYMAIPEYAENLGVKPERKPSLYKMYHYLSIILRYKLSTLHAYTYTLYVECNSTLEYINF